MARNQYAEWKRKSELHLQVFSIQLCILLKHVCAGGSRPDEQRKLATVEQCRPGIIKNESTVTETELRSHSLLETQHLTNLDLFSAYRFSDIAVNTWRALQTLTSQPAGYNDCLFSWSKLLVEC